MKRLSGVLLIVWCWFGATACATSSEVAVPAAPLIAFSDSLRIVEPAAPGTLEREAEALDDEEQRLEARLRELRQLGAERQALANLKQQQQGLAEAERELATVRSDTTGTVEQFGERLIQGQMRMAEQAREVSEAEIDYVEQRLEAIEAQRRVIRLAEQLEGAGPVQATDSAQAVERRAAARHRAERELVDAWVTYADLQQEAADRLRDWAYARRALIEERSALMGAGSS